MYKIKINYYDHYHCLNLILVAIIIKGCSLKKGTFAK